MPYPYTTGHVLIVTRRHVANLGAVSPAELNAMTVLARECERVYQSDGFKVGFNIGKSAGAGVAGHLHLQVVPRWEGDANFVSVIGQTRVVPEDLEATFDKLSPHFSSE